ncbi:MAG: glycosyltransferase family 87 protein [Anaerolineales bacterium]
MDSFFNRFWYLAVIIVIALLVGLSLANYYFVQQNPGGNDFLVHWVGTRALFVDGLSPYSDVVAERIQTLAYGRPAEPGEHELRVAYPLYSAVVFLPYALISDYDLARALWMTTLEVALIGLAMISLRLTRWKMNIWLLPFFLIFSLLWYHSLRPLINGNAVILVSLLLVASFAALRAGRDELAGILLAISTIKPHLVLLPIVFIIIWTISLRRWRTLGWMLISLVLLSAAAALLVPDWPLQNLREIMAYSSYNPPGTPGAVFEVWLPATGRQLGWALSVFLGLILLTEWVLVRGKEFRWFLWTGSLTLVISQWIGIQTDPGNFILLYFPLVLVFALWIERWNRSGVFMVIIAMALLFIGPWILFLETVAYGDQPLQHPVMFFPLPLFLLITLYWVRWWGVKPRSLLVDRLREYDQQV